MHSEKVEPVYSARTAYEPSLLEQEPGLASAEPIEAPRSGHSRARYKATSSFWKPGLAGLTWLIIGLGLCANGLAVTIARGNFVDAQWLFWAAITVPFVVLTTILVTTQPSPALRKFTIAAIGLYPSIVYRLSSPLVLGGFDEHLHEQELLNLLHGSGLFKPNPMLMVGPNYPGMELFTGVVVRLSGMSAVLAMSLVVLFCRLLLVFIIYHAALTVSPSYRVASLTVVFYAVSPQFYFFNSQFAYQTMALTLGLGGLLLLRRAQLAETQATNRWLSRVGILALLATVVTHHATSWIIFAFLALWTIVAPSNGRTILFRATSIMGIAIVCWTVIIKNQLVAYLGPIFSADFKQFDNFISGSRQRAIFGSSAGTGPTPPWERTILISYSLICAFAAIAVAWILLSRAFRTRDRMLGFLGVLCLASPITLAAHFVPSVGNLGDRASTFFFLPLSLSCSLVVLSDQRVAQHIAHRRRRASVTLASLISVTTIAYMGGVMLGVGPDWQWLPGSYLVSADPRTQDAETLAAVRWAAIHLPSGREIVADRVPAALLESQARLWPVTVPKDALEPAWLYFSPTWSAYQTAIVKGLRIQYIYVDQRLVNSLPHVGFYFYPGETRKPRHISTEDLAKFAHVPELRVIYHHGPVTIYNTTGFGVANQAKGFVGERTMGLGRVGDGALGALIVLLIAIFYQRLAWIKSMFLSDDAVSTTVAFTSVTIFIAGILFAFCSMPGPSFTIGAAITVILLAVAERRVTGKRPIPHIMAFRNLDFLIIVGLLASALGILVSIRAAWNVDVKSVDIILREVANVSKR